jgi:hypothetical protein
MGVTRFVLGKLCEAPARYAHRAVESAPSQPLMVHIGNFGGRYALTPLAKTACRRRKHGECAPPQ